MELSAKPEAEGAQFASTSGGWTTPLRSASGWARNVWC